MDRKKWSLRCRCGNKGIIFLLDVSIAFFIVILVLIAAIFFIIRAEDSSVEKLQISRIANDIFAVLHYTNFLFEFDTKDISNEIDSMLPEIYSMSYKIECEGRSYDSRITIPENFVFGGERVFFDSEFNNCIVRYWIWIE